MAVNLSELLQLPIEERLKLVQALWDSIPEFPEALELSAAQKQELDRRLEAYVRFPDDRLQLVRQPDDLAGTPRTLDLPRVVGR